MSNSIIFNLNRARMWSHDHDFVLFEKSIKRIEWYILNESSRMFRTKIISCPHRDRRKYQRNISLRSVQIRCFRSKKKKEEKKNLRLFVEFHRIAPLFYEKYKEMFRALFEATTGKCSRCFRFHGSSVTRWPSARCFQNSRIPSRVNWNRSWKKAADLSDAFFSTRRHYVYLRSTLGEWQCGCIVDHVTL